MSEHISPEEKLLRLIRGRGAGQAAAVKGGLLPEAAGRLRMVLSSLHAGKLFASQRFYYGLTAIAAFLLIGTFVSPLLFSQKIRALKPVDPALPELRADGAVDVKTFEYYSGLLAGHEIFGRLAVTEHEAASPGSTRAKAADLVGNLTLMGIVSGDQPQVILEDRKSQKTYYLSKGQSVGEVRIDDIKEGKVIVSCNGERFELYI